MGIRPSVGMLAVPLYKRISLLSLLLFLRGFHFSFSSIPVKLPVLKLIASNKPTSPVLNFFDFLLTDSALEIPNTAAIFQNGAKKLSIYCLFNILRSFIKISSQETKSSICLSTKVADLCIQSHVMCNCYS